MFTERQEKVERILKSGKHTVAQITLMTGFCDPRSYIRALRKKGINVLDEWVVLRGVRYKRYWI